MKRRYKLLVLALLLAGLAAVLPITVAAATNSEVIAIMKEVIAGVLSAGRDAYCASGVAALCP